jgi:ribosome recycling factor
MPITPNEFVRAINKLPNEARDDIKDIRDALDNIKTMKKEGVVTQDQLAAARLCVEYLAGRF